MTKRRSIVRKILLVLLLLPLVLGLFIQTTWGKVILAKTLSSALSRSDNQEIRIEKITGWIPAKMNISHIEISDIDGPWITAKNLHCRWMIRDLRNERVRFERLGADEITWHRFPRVGKRDKTKTRGDFRPLEIWLDDVAVKTLQLEKAVAGMALNYSVKSGGIAYLPDGTLTGKLTVGGDADGVVNLDAVLRGEETDELKISAMVDHVERPSLGQDALAGSGEAHINAQGVSAQLALVLGEQRLSTRLRYHNRMLNLQQLQYNGSGFSLLGDASLTFSNRLIDVAVDSVFVDVHTNRYDLRGMATVSTSNKTWGVDVKSAEIIGWESVALELSGMVSPDELKLAGSLKEMDFGELPMVGSSNFTGRVNGAFTVEGTLGQPEVVAGIDVVELSSHEDALDELPKLDFEVSAGISGGRLFAQTSMTKYSGGYLKADLEMPCEFSFSPFRYVSDAHGLVAHFDADMNLDVLNRLAVFQNQQLGGKLEADLVYENREPSGYLKIIDGHYEHFDWGLVVRRINADLDATHEGFVIQNVSASGSGDGTVDISGGWYRDGLGLHLDFANAWILRRDEVEAQLSGSLDVKGRALKPDVSGEITINRAEILLDNIIPAPPPLLTNYDSASTNRVVTGRKKNKGRPPFSLDLKVDIPDQVFVNAAMIEMVLGGNLHVTDIAEGISVKGEIVPRRGFVSFIGKKFRFTEGEIILDGSVPNIAILDNLTAEYSRRDVTARLILNGPANDPRFRLESDPAMPEDEVLSHVLFNRDTSSISPWQAYQIAAATRQLSGGLNGPGFMYQIRQVIGVDTLEWREAEVAGEASSVAAGKYITSGLYVEVNRSLDAEEQAGVAAELEVTRHFSVETYTGPEMRAGIGVNWRLDY